MSLMSDKAGLIFKAGALVLIACLTSAWNPLEAFAHVRHYVWSTEYQTLPKNGAEVESYVTMKVPDGHHSNANQWEYQEELEYGVTDHFSAAHYERWQTVNKVEADAKDATKYSGFKFEGKYRIGERGKYWVDPLLYFEISRDPREKDIPLTLEEKIILSKDIGKFNVVYNQIMESGTGSHGRTEHEFTVGMNYEIFSELFLGMETKGQYWNPGSHKNEMTLGPTIAYEAKYFWIAAGALFGVNHHGDDYQARIIIGVPFL